MRDFSALDLDAVYADTWIRRDANLGEQSYAAYLASDHWQQVKAKAKARPNYQKCEFCDSRDIELHHTSYKWILTKHELRTIISLCRAHHEEVHTTARANRVSVRVATNLLRNRYKPDFSAKNRLGPSG